MYTAEAAHPFLSNDPLARSPTRDAFDFDNYQENTKDTISRSIPGPLKKSQDPNVDIVCTDTADSTTNHHSADATISRDTTKATWSSENSSRAEPSPKVLFQAAGTAPTLNSAHGPDEPCENGISHHRDPAEVSAKLQSVTTEWMSGATKLKHYLNKTNELIVCPGVHDGFSARIAMSIGFDGLYMTGAGTTASRLGMADLGLAQLADMRGNAEMIANLNPYGPPLIADMDTGFGGPLVITEAVNQYIRAGVAGFHIEDQPATKRCGHLSGKTVVPAAEYITRIRAARAAIDYRRADIQLIARTDANQQLGYDECIARLRLARDAGADVGVLEGFKSHDEARRAVRDLAPWPLMLNQVEGGHSPVITVDEAREMGFRIVIFSFATLGAMFVAVKEGLQFLKKEGRVRIRDGSAGEQVIGPKQMFMVCGLEESAAIENAAAGGKGTFKEV
ncbi:MAG: hypothetical protein L6R37_007291 [Teloschistes peruensis]|nr:MAG: hypothetical protein L6R37_007291 [Teloschistes peruensis]